MSNSNILYSKKDRVGYITLNRPGAANSLDLSMAQELEETCLKANQDEELRVIVITGAGNIFCAGGDEGNLFSHVRPAEAIACIDRPTLAILNGDAFGQGLELALACDIRIASNKARLGLPQISKGLIPIDGGTQRLARIAGKGKALEMVLTGEIIDAQEALEIGLVNKVVGEEQLALEVEAVIKTIADKAPLALRYCKEAVNKGLDLTLEQGLRLEADLYFLLHTTADRTEGIRSFLEKRRPEYKGK